MCRITYIVVVNLAIACLSVMVVPSSVGQIAVIAHESVPEDSLSHNRLLDIYTGDRQLWDSRTPIVLVSLKEPQEVRDAFYGYLGRTSTRIKSLWLKRKLAGEGDAPTYLETEDEVLDKVRETPGSVGFVSGTKVAAGVKVLAWIEEEEEES